MEPFGYWLIGFLTLFAGGYTIRLVTTAVQPWIKTPQGESFMELVAGHFEELMNWLGICLTFSVVVGAVYASYCLGRDIAERFL